MNSFTLKMLACVFMLTDHVAQYVPGMPLWMHWVGRLASPLFLFVLGWSCEFTHDRRRFLLRLYVAGVLMSFVQAAWHVQNNVFTCLFQVAFIVMLLSIHERRRRLVGIVAYLAYQTLTIAVLPVIVRVLEITDEASYIIVATTGTVLGLEGGLFYVVVGVALWATHRSPLRMSLTFAALVALFALSSSPAAAWVIDHVLSWAVGTAGVYGMMRLSFMLDTLGIGLMQAGASMLTVNYQWMMIFALPFMLAYNRRRGPAVKWFFYVFYPLHIVVLASAATLASWAAAYMP